MWRIGVLVILSVIFASDAAQYQYGSQLQRIRRSPHYDCPPFYPPPPPRFWPPPPPHHHRHFGPPPYWPPPPQEEPFEGNRQQGQSQAESSVKSGALTQQGSQDSSRHTQQGSQDSSHQNSSQGQGLGEGPYPGSQPCDTCSGRGQNSAVSNAKSDTGSAIAIAISGKNGNQ